MQKTDSKKMAALNLTALGTEVAPLWVDDPAGRGTWVSCLIILFSRQRLLCASKQCLENVLTFNAGLTLQLYVHVGDMCLDLDPSEHSTERGALESLAPKVEMALHCTLRPRARGVYGISTVADSKDLLERADPNF
jgi:hypothetical protein